MGEPIKNLKVELEFDPNREHGKRKILNFNYRGFKCNLTQKFYEKIIKECGKKGNNFYIYSGFVYIEGLDMANIVTKAYNKKEGEII